jgi:hypothetical protein
MGLNKTGCEVIDRIQLAPNTSPLTRVLNMAMTIHSIYKTVELLDQLP